MAEQIKIILPEAVKKIINVLQSAGYEAWAVGGCVRDSILHREPDDWDITTSARPEQVKVLFHRTVDTGIQHGTVTVLMDRVGYEVTTYRIDGEYEDSRHPKEVTFTASLQEDLRRRDFTINAMAYNPEQGVIDIFGGQEDLEKGIIRCVGEASERFDEDALRILRAVRFAAQLDFVIENQTREAMRDQAKFLKDISAERICTELTKMIVSKHPERLEEAYELGLTNIFLPEFDRMMQTPQNNPYHLYDVGRHTLQVMRAVSATPVLRYAALLHDVGKPECKTTDETGVDHFYGHQELSAKMARTILRRLKLDNDTINQVCRLVRNHDYGLSGGGPGMKSFRRFVAQLGAEHFADFLEIRKGDMAGQSAYHLEQRRQVIAHMEAMYAEIIEQKQCLKLSELEISGKDLIAIGVKPGPDMGRILKALLDRVLEEPELNTREQLLAIVKESYL